MTDAPDTDDSDATGDYGADAPNATDNDAASTESKKTQYSLRKRNKYFKNSYNTKTPHKKITDAPDGHDKIAADYDAADAPNNSDNDDVSTDSKKYQIY